MCISMSIATLHKKYFQNFAIQKITQSSCYMFRKNLLQIQKFYSSMNILATKLNIKSV